MGVGVAGTYASALVPPPGPVVPLPRNRITDALSRSSRRTVTLVSAPAGYGKTVALGDWYRLRAPEGSAGWVTLGESDHDPSQFWTLVVSAVRTQRPHALPETWELLAAGDTAEGSSFTHTVVNEICRMDEPFTVVVDDFDVIDYDGLLPDFVSVVEHLPESFRFILATRARPRLPLLTWKTKGRLSEIGPAVLRFTDEEARTYLDLTVAGELSTTQEDELVARCDGWIACLYLASLRLLEGDRTTEFMRALAAAPSPIVEFLATEVIEALPAPLIDFVEETSIVESLTLSSATLLTGQPDSRIHLEVLRDSGLLTPIPKQPGALAYHPLLLSVLRHRLGASPHRSAELHRRAASVYEDAGRLDLAIRHTIAAGGRKEAAVALLNQADVLLASGRHTVTNLLAELPEWWDSEHRDALAWLAQRAALVDGTLDALRTATEIDVESDAPVARGAALATRLLEGDHEAVCVELETSGDQHLPTTVRLLLRGHARTATERFDAGAADLRLLLDRRPNDPFVELAAMSVLAWNHVAAGRLGLGRTMAGQAVDLATRRTVQWFHALRYAELALAQVEYDRGNLDEAHRLASRIADRPTSDALIKVRTAILRSSIEWSLGNRAMARDVLDDAMVAPDGRPTAGVLALRATLAQAELYLKELDVDLAESWLPDWQDRVAAGPGSMQERSVLARFLIAAGRSDEAHDMLREANGGYASLRERLESAKLAAIAAIAAKEETAPMRLEIALAMGEPERYVQTYVDDSLALASVSNTVTAGVGSVQTALVRQRTANGQKPDDGRRELIEELTDRELAVLRLLPSRLSNKEIASELFVSVNTVKSHIRSIYRKLGVTSRNDAIARATTLRLS